MKIIAVVGPERSATRFMSKLVSLSPDVEGLNAYHHDLGAQTLDEVWDCLRKEKLKKAKELFLEKVPSDKHALTRRCFPHGGFYDRLRTLKKLAAKVGRELVVIVLTRDRNVVATSQHRVNKSHSLDWNYDKIRNAYKMIFEDIDKLKLKYVVLNYETLILLKGRYLTSVFQSLGITPPADAISGRCEDGNKKYVNTRCDAPTEFQAPYLYRKSVIHNETKDKKNGIPED